MTLLLLFFKAYSIKQMLSNMDIALWCYKWMGCTGRMGLEISGFIIGCLCVNVTLKNRQTISENTVVYIYASVQVAAKFLMRKLRQYPQTWQPAEMNTFPFKCIFFYFQFYSKISTNTENCTFLFNLRCFTLPTKYPQTLKILSLFCVDFT